MVAFAVLEKMRNDVGKWLALVGGGATLVLAFVAVGRAEERSSNNAERIGEIHHEVAVVAAEALEARKLIVAKLEKVDDAARETRDLVLVTSNDTFAIKQLLEQQADRLKDIEKQLRELANAGR